MPSGQFSSAASGVFFSPVNCLSHLPVETAKEVLAGVGWGVLITCCNRHHPALNKSCPATCCAVEGPWLRGRVECEVLADTQRQGEQGKAAAVTL